MPVLLRDLGVHAAVSTLLCAPLFHTEPVADSNADSAAHADSDCQ
jgi:hypothetical protein